MLLIASLSDDLARDAAAAARARASMSCAPVVCACVVAANSKERPATLVPLNVYNALVRSVLLWYPVIMVGMCLLISWNVLVSTNNYNERLAWQKENPDKDPMLYRDPNSEGFESRTAAVIIVSIFATLLSTVGAVCGVSV